MSEEQIELIDKYIKGELNAEQRAAFEQELSVNKDLQTALDAHIQLIRAVEKAGLKAAIQNADLHYKKWMKIKWGIATAGGLIALTTAAILLLQYFNVIEPNFLSSKQTQLIQNRADSTLTKQVFIINNQQDTVIETKDGIVLFIPANASVDEDGQVVQGTVNYQIQEALKPSDIIFAGLDTRSNGKLLETGGMFKIVADHDGEILQLNPQKQITAQVPTFAHKEGMQLYDGEYQKDGNINWVNPKPLENYIVPVDMKLLNFLPAGFEHKVQSLLELDMDMLESDKPFFDSLYFSFAIGDDGDLVHSETYYTKPRYPDLEDGNDEVVNFETGLTLFEKNCASCHAANSILVGPSLNNITKRRDMPWLKKWIKNPAAMIASGDPYAVKLAQQYKSAGVMSGYPNLKESDIESIIDYADALNNDLEKQTVGHSDSTMSVVAGAPYVDPASVKSIWNKDYNNTILATREFEKRMRIIHTTCKQAVLDLYIKNLDKNLWEIDEMAAELLDGDLKKQFQNFARLKNGKVKVENKQIAYLTKYYNKKYEAVKKVLKLNLEAQNKLKRDREIMEEKAFERKEKLLEEEIELNTKEVYKQLGINPVKIHAENQFIMPPVYTATVTSFGWKNIDKLTEERQTFTVSENGKTAKIEYEPLVVKVNEPQKFDKVMAYLIPDKLSTYMRMPEENQQFKEQLNKNIHYTLLVVGYVHDDIYYFSRPDIKADFTEAITLSKTDKKDFENRMYGFFRPYANGIVEDFKNEMISIYQDVQEMHNKVSAKKINAIREELYDVVFPCSDRLKPRAVFYE